jgi:hypothetical protein
MHVIDSIPLGCSLLLPVSTVNSVEILKAHDGTTMSVTMSGPADNWFGVGFNAGTMADAPYVPLPLSHKWLAPFHIFSKATFGG